jgi:hypothetical protein
MTPIDLPVAADLFVIELDLFRFINFMFDELCVIPPLVESLI